MKTIPTNNLELELKNKGYKCIIGIDEAGRGCEHPSAEILTNNGWKYYTDVSLDDLVLSYTSEGFVEWQSIDDIVEKEFNGELIELKNRGIHILVTPNHYFDVLKRVFKRDKDDNNKLKMVGYKFRGRKCVSELLDNDFIPRGGKWAGFSKDFFVLPSIDKIKYDHSGKDYDEKYIPINIWVSFMGIYLSEGSSTHNNISGGYNVSISQSKKSRHYYKIRDLLDKMPFKFNEVSIGFEVYNKQLYNYLKQFGNKYNKFIPRDIKELDANLLNLFIKWLIMGDGACYTNKGRKEVCTYYTTSSKLKDDLEEVLLKAGWTYHTVFRKPKDSFIGNRLIKKENKRKCFEIRLRRNNKVAVKHLYKKLIPYSGKVFCLRLSKYHNFFVRRNGTGYFTGNSLAGPVVAAGVCIPDGFDTTGINDSKKLSSKTRELFYNKIITSCVYAISEVDERIIDEINIRESTMLAMRNVIYNMPEADFALIDGNFIPELIDIPAQPIIGGDRLSVSIAAASIVAKVYRDGLMLGYHIKWPAYGFDKNKGYGTKHHREIIKMIGPCPIHRKSFRRVKEYI